MKKFMLGLVMFLCIGVCACGKKPKEMAITKKGIVIEIKKCNDKEVEKEAKIFKSAIERYFAENEIDLDDAIATNDALFSIGYDYGQEAAIRLLEEGYTYSEVMKIVSEVTEVIEIDIRYVCEYK